jgi:hypothetical protein
VSADLKEIRDSIDYGTRMNRRLHHLPFPTLQIYTSYKASFEDIPTGWTNPEYTRQRCPICGHTERANRNKKRFKCKDCESLLGADRSSEIGSCPAYGATDFCCHEILKCVVLFKFLTTEAISLLNTEREPCLDAPESVG